jgi:CheY-like chemotaxis protein
MMPEMDGVETARRIRAMGGEFEKLPILALTANAMKGVKEMLLANGMDDYMSKPVEMWELSEKLRHGGCLRAR